MSAPGVSVVIAVYNGERYLGEAIASALSQQPRPDEVVVVDDGSTDAGGAIAAGFGSPVRLISQANRGAAAARNVGAASTSGQYLAFLDADDLWTDGALPALLRPLQADSRTDIAFGHVREFVTPGLGSELAARLSAREGLLPGFLVGSMLVRSPAFTALGGFREDLASGELMDWVARARDVGLRHAVVDDQVLWRRVHGQNHGIRRVDARGDYARVLKSALDRRRAAAEATGEETSEAGGPKR